MAADIAADRRPGTEIPAGAVPVRPPKVTSARLVSNLTLLVLGILFLAPLVWLILASVDANASQSLQWPHFTLRNFTQAANSANLLALKNSVLISAIGTVVATIPATLAGYVFSRRHIPFKGPLLLGILMLAGIPVAILIVPIYQVFAVHNWLALVPASVFLGVTSLPFEIWIIKNFIDAVPEIRSRSLSGSASETAWKRSPRNLSSSSGERNVSSCPVSTSSRQPSNRPSDGFVFGPKRTTKAHLITWPEYDKVENKA